MSTTLIYNLEKVNRLGTEPAIDNRLYLFIDPMIRQMSQFRVKAVKPYFPLDRKSIKVTCIMQIKISGITPCKVDLNNFEEMYNISILNLYKVRQFRVVASWSKASYLGLALRNARWFESSWGKKFSHEISASVWDRCPPNIVMHFRSYDRTDRLDTATCTHTLLSTDVHIRTDHVRYTLRYLHCFSVDSYPHSSDSALN
ncbi:hypothetical protein ANN_24124 [Periplaneta americana]|uniref:C-type lectin domain-containing protein n=1 Tax=Periplaneta americana TaxID=6978 RepID=A0ABQ8S2G4_PERAM|nr:hypothetical protein ANN_24124 [Periplaneta americana]